MIVRQLGRRPVLIVAAVVLLLAAVVTGTVLRPSQDFQLPWHDGFAAGDTAGWQAFGGAWSVYRGGIRNNSDERGAKFITGSTAWSDYAVDADVSLLGDDGDAGIIVRSTDEEEGVDSYSGYYVGLRDSNNSITIGRADHGWIEYQAVSPRRPLQPSRWYHLHVVAVGCDIAAEASGDDPSDRTLAAMHESPCARTGRIGLRSYSSGGVWRNIRVVRAGPADIQPLLARAPPAPAPGVLQSEIGFNSLRLNKPGINSEFAEALLHAATTPLSAIGDLSTLSPVQTPVATIRGNVTLTSPRVYVQDASGGAAVEFSHPPSLKLGDEVQVTGQVVPSRFSAVLRHATGRVLWQRSPAPPVSVSAAQAATGLYDARFIETEAEAEASPQPSSIGTVLLLQSGHQRFLALLDSEGGRSSLGDIAPHSTVVVRGVCVVDPAFTGNSVPFAILLRSSSDVLVLAGPPWWDLRNLIAAAIALPFVALLGFLLYSRADRWRMQAVLDERLRMAREIHDTLAQGYAAIALQLESALDRDRGTSAPQAVAVALHMAERSRGEAHLSIAALRALHFDAPFPALLRYLLGHQIAGDITLDIRNSGGERRLPVETEANLLRIIQEGVANTIRHAHASLIEVELLYSPEFLDISVLDNGRGFNPDHAPGAENGHYGITGMRERSARIGANFQIASGSFGTRISVRVPLPRSDSIARSYVLSVFRRTGLRNRTANTTATRHSEGVNAKAHSRFDLG